ncbi:MAG TPA: VWA domain-containing protein [Gammaproteobacteria bacterium]
MVSMMQEFHFLRPEWFWALPPLALLLAWFVTARLRSGQWVKVVDPQLLAHVLTGQGHRQRLWPLALLGIAGVLTVTALAGPAWKKLPQPVFKDRAALMILLDLSRSMDSQDLKPSRLQRAQHKLTDILRQRSSGQTGLIVYAAQPYTVTPLTDDTETINAHVSSLTTGLMPAQGSRPELAIHKAMELFEQAGVRNGKVLFITDDIQPGRVANAVDALYAAGHELLILGVGTADGAPVPVPGGGFLKNASGGIVIPKLDENALQQVVAGRGRYHRLTIDDTDINFLLSETQAAGLNLQTESTELKTDVWRDEGPWLLLPVLLLTALAFRRGLLLAGVFILLPLPQPAEAFEWSSLWLNDNQRGARKLDEGNAQQAAALFDDPQWRGVAQYRAGNYEAAVETLDGIETADALYNKGNALARLGRTPEAVAAYEQALKLDPKHEDARHNRDLLLKQQQQQDSQQNQNGENDQDQQNGDQQNAQQNQDGGTQQQSDGQQSPQQQDRGGQQAENSDSMSTDDGHGDQSDSEQMERQPGQRSGQEASRNDAQADETGESEEELKEQTPQAQEQTAETDDALTPDAQQQAMQQWLRRIPDDPSGLLRRKFLYQYRQQQKHSPPETDPW